MNPQRYAAPRGHPCYKCGYMNTSEAVVGNLHPNYNELLELTELAGIHTDSAVIAKIIQLLNKKIAPSAIVEILKNVKVTIDNKAATPPNNN